MGTALMGASVWAEGRKVRIGVCVPSHCAMPVLWARSQGLYREQGLRVEVVFCEGMPALVEELRRGRIHFAQLITSLALAVHAGSRPFRTLPLALTQFVGINGGVLAVSSCCEMERLGDLKGRRIGVHSPWMVHSLILGMALRKAGLKMGEDVEVVVVPMSKMPEALKRGEIDAVINPEPLPSFLESQGALRTLFTTRIFWRDHPCCGLVTTAERLRRDRELVEAVTLATTIAGLELQNPVRRKEAIARIHDEVAPYREIPLTVLFEAFRPGRSDFYPFPFRSAGMVLAEEMAIRGQLPRGTEPESLVDGLFQWELAMEVMEKASQRVEGTVVPSGPDRRERLFLRGWDG